jgi:GDP-D-mannose dehydratase
MTKKALITGVTGQDGSYLAELLLEKGYEGMVLNVAHLRLILNELIISIKVLILTIKTSFYIMMI